MGESTRALGDPGREAREVLGGQGVQPVEAIRSADADDAAVGQVDETVARHEGALLTVERPVVRRDRSVDAVAATAPSSLSKGLAIGISSVRNLCALHTLTVHGQMTEVGIETLLSAQSGDKGCGHTRVNGLHAVTIPADEVEVGVPGVGVVRRGSVTEVGMANHADLFEHFEGAIDGGDVDDGRLTAYFGQDLVRRRVAQILDCPEDQLALRSQSVSTVTQPLLPIWLGVIGMVVVVCGGWVGSHARCNLAHRWGCNG